MKHFLFFLMILAIASPANAQEADTLIDLPWGDLLANGADTLVMIIIALLGWAMRLLPAHILAVVQTWQVEQILARAITAGINKTAGAAKGKALTVDVGNAVLAQALQYVIDNAPAWLIKWAGGEEGLRDKLIARLDVEASAALK